MGETLEPANCLGISIFRLKYNGSAERFHKPALTWYSEFLAEIGMDSRDHLDFMPLCHRYLLTWENWVS